MSGKIGPDINENGLVLYLDAANRNSYPGSGTSWFDLSGNSNTTTLTNGPTFNGSNMGGIVFDGVDDYVNFYAPNLSSIAVIEMWAKITISAGSFGMLFGWASYDVFYNAGNFGYNTFSANDIYGISSATVTGLQLLNNWKHYVFEMRSDVSYINNKIYVNGISQSLSQQVSSESAGNRNFNSGLGAISTARGSAFYTPMTCGSFKVYNRALSATEILQNYNAVKSRFGL
jgi:hypothetical protein